MVAPAASVRAARILAASVGCVSAACARAPSLAGPPESAWLTEVGAASGLVFEPVSGARGAHALPEIMGGGVALFDAEADGDLDAYCVSGNAPRSELASPEGTSTFFRQVSPGRFVEATREAGLVDDGHGMGVAVADVDNDGDEDVYVTHWGPNALFVNQGDGRFEERTAAAGCAGDGWSSSAAFFDLDRDGFLDLYVARYVEYRAKECFDSAGRPDYCGPKAFAPESDLLFRNAGGNFRDVSRSAGIDAHAAAGLGVVCADLDEDGWQDVYVANDAYANFLWINRRDGTFAEEAVLRGAAYNLSGQPQAGMGLALGDFDGDERLDLFVTHLREEPNTLYLNRGPAGFRDASGESRVGPVSMPFTGFGVAALDLDRDMDLDLAIANGAVFHRPRVEGVALAPPWDEYAEPGLLQLNAGGGRFVTATSAAGTFASAAAISRGLAAGDVDGDGDPDLLVGQIGGPARLFRNDAPAAGHHWIALRCVHPGWRRDALGARLTLVAGGRRQVRVLSSSTSYASSSAPVAYFGLGPNSAVDAVEVLWPDGRRERFVDLGADRSHVLVHGTGGE